MSKRKPMDKTQARERRNRLLETAAAAELSLTEGVREMRAIAGMTQQEFAQHRGVSARVIKAIELGQGNPTVATLNRIGEFFGLEVAFVPVRRKAETVDESSTEHATLQSGENHSALVRTTVSHFLPKMKDQENVAGAINKMRELIDWLESKGLVEEMDGPVPKKRKPPAP
jgi:transcriptional regulator with XRE-family HTH domain